MLVTIGSIECCFKWYANTSMHFSRVIKKSISSKSCNISHPDCCVILLDNISRCPFAAWGNNQGKLLTIPFLSQSWKWKITPNGRKLYIGGTLFQLPWWRKSTSPTQIVKGHFGKLLLMLLQQKRYFNIFGSYTFTAPHRQFTRQ